MLPLMNERCGDGDGVTVSPRGQGQQRAELASGAVAFTVLHVSRPAEAKLATWTSCFRIYRKQQIVDLPLVENGFLGTAELAAQLSLHGSKDCRTSRDSGGPAVRVFKDEDRTHHPRPSATAVKVVAIAEKTQASPEQFESPLHVFSDFKSAIFKLNSENSSQETEH
jgi:hypothetical protein